MREILFRGKAYTPGLCYNPCPNGWIYGFYGTKDGASFISEVGKYASGKSFFSDALVAPESVGQYTGLKDKNGKRIFEGDIVTFKTSVCTFKPCVIEYSNTYARFVARIEDRCYPMDDAFVYEIIGNIHDNPELLQEV